MQKLLTTQVVQHQCQPGDQQLLQQPYLEWIDQREPTQWHSGHTKPLSTDVKKLTLTNENMDIWHPGIDMAAFVAIYLNQGVNLT